jgi:hypothetical protein
MIVYGFNVFMVLVVTPDGAVKQLQFTVQAVYQYMWTKDNMDIIINLN